jgi:nijmegen breakage syndrome protein 1
VDAKSAKLARAEIGEDALPNKTIWIVDAAYLMKAALGRFDYLKLKSALESLAGSDFFESYYLNSTPNPPTDAQDAFHTWLKTAPPNGPKMRVQLYKLKDLHVNCPTCAAHFDRPVQKGVDVGIATLILKLATQGQYDRLVLAAGDGDFEDAIAYVKSELHKEIWIAGFEGSVSADLQSYADKVLWLNASWDFIRKT